MDQTLFALAFHAYTLGALLYLTFLARPLDGLAKAAKVVTTLGLLLHGTGLFLALSAQGFVPRGIGQGVAITVFILVLTFLLVDWAYRLPVVGAFLSPLALALWVPALWLGKGETAAATRVRAPLLPVHITLALVGLAVFAMAAGVGAVYLLMERELKGKRFGLLFSRLPSLQVLDDLNRRLVVIGFIALSLTLVTGAFFSKTAEPVWFLRSSEIITALVAWLVYAALVQARLVAGWRGRRVAVLTMAGFCLMVMCFISSYELGLRPGGLP